MNRSQTDIDRVRPAEAFRVFGRIGLLSFGGPAAQIAVMHRILVEEKKWLSEQQFLHALNFCMLLPGPEAMQLATYAGWLMNGVRGGLAAGLLFVLPGLAMMLAFSAMFVVFGDLPAVDGLLYGLKAAVLAVVAEALLRVSRKALKSRAMVTVSIAAFAAIAIFKIPFPLIIFGAALAGLLLWRPAPRSLGMPAGRDADQSAIASDRQERVRHGQAIATALAWLAVWLLPLGFLVMAFGQGQFFADAALFFSKTAVVTFGGAYAVLVYVAQQAVEAYQWLMPDEMLTGLGLAETTLGPLVLVLVFVGFVGGARLGGPDPLLGGLAGGLVAAFFTFAPCFLWIFAGAPYVEALRNVRWLSASLAAITAAVVGVIANLAVWFGLHVLFGPYDELKLGPAYLPIPEIAALDIPALAIALGAGIALLRYHANMIAVLAVSAGAGLAIRMVL